jgi:hypothetical protein
MTTTVQLDSASVESVARRVVELLRGESVAGERIDAAEVARLFGCSRDWVYANADRLGAVRLGDGPKARLRFDLATAKELLNKLTVHKERQSPQHHHRSIRRSGSADLLPIRGELP